MAKKSNQRANVKNPNNPAYKAATDNRLVQLNVDQTNSPVQPILSCTK